MENTKEPTAATVGPAEKKAPAAGKYPYPQPLLDEWCRLIVEGYGIKRACRLAVDMYNEVYGTEYQFGEVGRTCRWFPPNMDEYREQRKKAKQAAKEAKRNARAAKKTEKQERRHKKS